MKTNQTIFNKEKTYVSPMLAVIEVKCESFLQATSPDNGNAGNDGDPMT